MYTTISTETCIYLYNLFDYLCSINQCIIIPLLINFSYYEQLGSRYNINTHNHMNTRIFRWKLNVGKKPLLLSSLSSSFIKNNILTILYWHRL